MNIKITNWEFTLSGRRTLETGKILNSVSSVDKVFAEKISTVISKDNISFEEVRKKLSILRSLDTDTLARDALTKYQLPHILVQILELVRNSLILVPIALTWLSLAMAVSLFANSPEENSFLILWEQGFDGKLPLFLRFSHVAIVDAILIIIIIVATFLINIKIHILDEWAISKALNLKNRVDELLMAVETDLYNLYSSLAPTEEKNLETIVLQFEKLATNVETQNRSLLNYVVAEKERLSSLSLNQIESVEGLKSAATTFYQGASSIVDSVRDLRSDLSNWKNEDHSRNEFSKEINLNLLDYINHIKRLLTVFGNEKNNKNTNNIESEENVLSELKTSVNVLNNNVEKMLKLTEIWFDEQRRTDNNFKISLPEASEKKLPEAIKEINIDNSLQSSIIKLLTYSSLLPVFGLFSGLILIAWSFFEKTIDSRSKAFAYFGFIFNIFIIVFLIFAVFWAASS